MPRQVDDLLNAIDAVIDTIEERRVASQNWIPRDGTAGAAILAILADGPKKTNDVRKQMAADAGMDPANAQKIKMRQNQRKLRDAGLIAPITELGSATYALTTKGYEAAKKLGKAQATPPSDVRKWFDKADAQAGDEIKRVTDTFGGASAGQDAFQGKKAKADALSGAFGTKVNVHRAGSKAIIEIPAESLKGSVRVEQPVLPSQRGWKGKTDQDGGILRTTATVLNDNANRISKAIGGGDVTPFAFDAVSGAVRFITDASNVE